MALSVKAVPDPCARAMHMEFCLEVANPKIAILYPEI